MWAVVIIVVAPCRDHSACLAQRREQMFVEAFLAHPSVEAFDKAVLHGLSWRDVMPTDVSVFLPFEHRVAGQFGAVVADHHTGVFLADNFGFTVSETASAIAAPKNRHSRSTFPA